MGFPLALHVSFVMALLLVLQPSPTPLVNASRDDETREVELSSGSHFVSRKVKGANATRQAVLSTVQKHQAGEDASFASQERALANSPEMQEQMSLFKKATTEALSNAEDPSMSQADKNKSVNEALTIATQAMVKMTSLVDPHTDPELASKLKEKMTSLQELAALEKKASSLIEKKKSREDPPASKAPHSKGPPMTPEMRKQVAAFSDAAMMVMANKLNPDVNAADKQKSVQDALAQAAKAVNSLAAGSDSKQGPELAHILQEFQEHIGNKAPKAPSLIETHQQATFAGEGRLSKSGVTPEMREQVAAFSRAALQAIANGKNSDMSNEDKQKAVQAALAQAAKAMSSIAEGAGSKDSVLAGKLANLKELSKPAPSLIEKNAETTLASEITPEIREQVAAFGKIASQALANGRNPDMSPEQQAEHVQKALSEAANVMTSLAPFANKAKAPGMLQRLAALKELTAFNGSM